MKLIGIYIQLVLLLLLAGCTSHRAKPTAVPWGDVSDTVAAGDAFDLDQIMAEGEMIALTLTGPQTYYDYHGRALGTSYLLCQRFADHLGVRLRVEVCRDSAELASRRHQSDVVLGVPVTTDSARVCIEAAQPQLRAALSEWYKPSLLRDVEQQQSQLLSGRGVERRVYAPMLNRSAGIISNYDALFQRYAPTARWDWRLLAAQCYQESTFDPQARSWAGACGLMQIMPSTASRLGLPSDKLFEPEANIEAAVRYIGQLNNTFSDIPERSERINFVLAAYNGGAHHIRDAMELARQDGARPQRWADVERYVLLLSEPEYYNRPVVKNGYMRGSETVDYVRRIRQRWAQYRGAPTSRFTAVSGTPQRAKTHKRKYHLEAPSEQ